MGWMHVIPAGGVPTAKEIREEPFLEELQGLVRGDIEVVPVYFNGKRCQMVVNDVSAIRDGFPVNPLATSIYHHTMRELAKTKPAALSRLNHNIYGDVVIFEDFQLT